MAECVNRAIGALGKPRHMVLGMDPGIASCGFALIDTENHEVLEMGVRLFDSPVHPKTKQSLASVRRGYRSVRRNIDRTQDRLKHCLGLLKRYTVVPQDADKEYFHTVKGDKPPLSLRVDGLDRLLTNREWAIVLYSLCKHRGYIPHGEGDSGASGEEGKVLSALRDNEEQVNAAGLRTVGEWLATKPRSRNRGGNYEMCIAHAQLVDEARILFAAQRSFGSQVASSEMEASFIDVFDWERSREEFDRRTYDLVGMCTYFPNEKRAARCTLTSELVAAYGALGNVSMRNSDGKTRALTAEERDACIRILFSAEEKKKKTEDKKITYAWLRKTLDLEHDWYFKGVAVADEKTREVYKPQGWRVLRGLLGKENVGLLARLREDRDLADAVFEAAAYSSAQPVLEKRLLGLDLNEGELSALMAIPYASRALNGYGSRSKKALDILLDCFEDEGVLTLTDAEQASGLEGWRIAGPQIDRSERLMPYELWIAKTGRTNNNPVVIRALSQMRKVVNAVCRKWGVPNEIHVELDRELRLPKKAKDEIAKANRKNEKERQRIAGEIAEIRGCEIDMVSGKEIEKYRLWEEQGNFDIYTGDRIRVERLVSDDTYTQVDHVLPFSRTGDNSRHNKVLVLSRSNQLKREQSPYEWMTSGAEGAPSWHDFKRRVEENGRLSTRKKAFLLEVDLSSKEGEFQSRNMRDTAYMSREVCAYLSDCLLFPKDGAQSHVVPVAGRATAWLRRQWGLNFGVTGEKDRSDDRHHATDGCVIAACSRSLVIKTAKVMKETHWRVTETMTHEERKAARREALRDTMPWPTFADEVRARRDFVVPTRFVPRKGTGKLYEETVYAYRGKNAKGKDLGVKVSSGGSRLPEEKTKVMGNAVVSLDGKSVVNVGDMLCLRLWFDSEAKRRGGGAGRWYADPVYVVDVPAIQDGTYIPRIAKAHIGRDAWEPIPGHVLTGTPIEIYLGDLVCVGDKIGRYSGFNIDNADWSFVDLLTREPIKLPTVGMLDGELAPQLIREDILRAKNCS